MRKNPPGYPLPSGELGSDDIVCQLVYLPDQPEYWQALYMALAYFATWRAWERDDDKRGKDAAADWRAALELTTRCWRMACLEEITDRLDIMIDLLGNQPGCCGATSIGPIITVVTNIEPGVGDDPTEWGETEVADWEEWSEYICHHAHQYVDTLVNSAKALDLIVELGSYTVEFFTDIMRTLHILPLGYPVSLTDMIERYQAFRDEDEIVGMFGGIGDKFEAARQDIVCAIVQGGSLQDAVEDAVDDNAVWILFYLFTDYAAVQAVIYEGTADGTEYLAPIKRADCDTCGYEQQDNTTVHVEKVWGESVDYNSETKEWTIPSWGVGGCEQSSFTLWETAAKITKKPCKVVVTSCTGSTQCSSLESDRGILATVEQYDYTHPPLAQLGLSLVDDYRHLHVAAVEYDLTFKLYTLS